MLYSKSLRKKFITKRRSLSIVFLVPFSTSFSFFSWQRLWSEVQWKLRLSSQHLSNEWLFNIRISLWLYLVYTVLTAQDPIFIQSDFSWTRLLPRCHVECCHCFCRVNLFGFRVISVKNPCCVGWIHPCRSQGVWRGSFAAGKDYRRHKWELSCCQ